eukprot:2149181-Amphidinium_carterae.1
MPTHNSSLSDDHTIFWETRAAASAPGCSYPLFASRANDGHGHFHYYPPQLALSERRLTPSCVTSGVATKLGLPTEMHSMEPPSCMQALARRASRQSAGP